MNKIVIPTAYNPPAIYFAFLIVCQDVLIEIHETFPKRTWRNRCSILTSQGVMDLTIPVKRSNNSKTCEVIIETAQKWQNNHWRAIESAYNKSPFFIYYRDELQQLIYKNETNLVRFNQCLMNFFLRIYKIKTNIQFSDEYQKNISEYLDFREKLNPKKESMISLELFPKYYQVFGEKFYPNLSILDLLNNEGPDGMDYLINLSEKIKIVLT